MKQIVIFIKKSITKTIAAMGKILGKGQNILFKLKFLSTKSFKNKNKNLSLNILYFRLICVGFVECLWSHLTKDTQLVPRRSTDTVFSQICLFYLQNPAIRLRSKSIIQTKSALELARYCGTKLQSINSDSNHFQSNHFCQTLSNMRACQHNPASTKRSYKNNYFFLIKHTEYSFPKQSNETRNLFQCNDLFIFPFKMTNLSFHFSSLGATNLFTRFF